MKELLIKMIFVYKRVSVIFRETRPPLFVYTDCKFFPSCSEYAIRAINKHGPVRGLVKSLLRILKCSPLFRGGVDFP